MGARKNSPHGQLDCASVEATLDDLTRDAAAKDTEILALKSHAEDLSRQLDESLARVADLTDENNTLRDIVTAYEEDDTAA